MRLKSFSRTLMLGALAICTPAFAQQFVQAPEPQVATILGTVTDVRGDVVPDATVVLKAEGRSESRTITADDNGFFSAPNVQPAVTYHVVISAPGFAPWTSAAITPTPGQYLQLDNIRLEIAEAVTTVTATVNSVEIATEQVEVEEKQRVLGFIPNFYTVYDAHPAPLTAKLKFRLALHTSIDPVTFAGSAFIAGVDQAGDTPRYQQGAAGYGQRFGANYANGFSDILFGGAILPSLLHQDPRYYYQGTDSTKSRVRHALTAAFVCHGDNGQLQPNYSSIGGFLISGALAETYYPDRDRGPALVFNAFAIDVAANMANGIIQEFVLRRLTPSTKGRH